MVYDYMFFSTEIITLILVAIVNTVIAWVLASQGWKVVVNRYFIIGVLCVILWALGTLLFMISDSQEMAYTGLAFFYIAPMFTVLFLSLFAAVFPANNGVALTIPNTILCLFTAFFTGAIVFMPDFLTASVQLHSGGHNVLEVQPFWYTLYTFYYTYGFSVIFISFWLQIQRNSGSQKKQLEYIFAGTFLAALFSLITNLFLPALGVSQFIWLGPTWTLSYVVMVSISIVKHQLFDIKLAAVRSIAYVCVLATLSAIYYLTAYILSVVVLGAQMTNDISVSPVNIVLALILAFLFQPIKHFFDRLSHSIFYRDDYNSETFFQDLSELLASTTDLRGILQRASEEIAMTLKAEQCFFFLHYTNTTDHHLSSGTKHHARLPLFDAKMLGAYVMSHDDDQIIRTDILSEESDVRRMLVSHQIALVMPLRHKRRIIGYVCLGDNQGSGYVKRDLRVLTTISNELVIAIQNALSVHEVREINATLQQRIHVATAELRESNAQLHRLDVVKDEFVSMASHQLRTPLTSVKGYISMMLDGDVGKITDMQRHALEEAFNSSERMVRLIGDFLSVSRLQTGKFIIDRKPVDFVKIVGQEVEGLRMIASTHGQKLTYVFPKQLQLINLDESKIRQVVMNFIDNAIYYSKTGTTIHVAIGKINDELVFTVEDSGIGVPKDQQPKLFSKFYRATNARQQRPDGTGVGLYLAKKVILEHGGKVIFSSAENQGSTFGFRMPLNQESNEPNDKNNEGK